MTLNGQSVKTLIILIFLCQKSFILTVILKEKE